MITLDDILKTRTISESALVTIAKIVYCQSKAYVQSTDKQTFWEFGKNILSKIKSLEKQINNETYSFQPCKKIIRKMKSNKVREIYLSTWRDKIIERWLNDGLSILLHDWYSKHSYAYRVEGVSLDKCMNQISGTIRGSDFFIKRDIKSYFYTIDHDILLNKVAEIVDKNDFLYNLIEQRVRYKYINEKEEEVRQAIIGVPFGSSLACALSNIYLTDLDKNMERFKIKYFRYADDFLMAGNDPEEVLKAANYFDEQIGKLKLSLKQSHNKNLSFRTHEGFTRVNYVPHLGIEFSSKCSKISVEKQRKIINFFKRAIKYNKSKIKKLKMDDRLPFIISILNDVVGKRIRSAAIVDYYLKHTSDESQLGNMDRIITELVISTALNKKFRKKDFQKIPYWKLRKLGLISLLHRSRLHRHGHLKINFLSLYNDKIVERHDAAIQRKINRIDTIKLGKEAKKYKS